VLFRWLDGRRVDAGLRPTHLERMGAFLARLQDHGAQFRLPPGLERGRVDTLFVEKRDMDDPFAPVVVTACRTLVADTLGPEAAAQVGAVLHRVQQVEQTLGPGPATFGLIHADLHQYNVLFSGGGMRAIDFDDCGFGPRLYDLAVPLTILQDRATYPALRAGLLAGYRRVRPLSAAEEHYLDTFMALRQVQDLLWVLQEREQPALRDGWAALARRMVATLATFLADDYHFPHSLS
jgi:Ser/Thr protein kinase RdoA (MazF antagonist)